MTEKKVFWMRFLKITALLIPCILLVLLMPLDTSKDTRTIHDFYLEEEDSLDVIFMGASDVYTGFHPVLAYQELGFTSYCHALANNSVMFLPYQLQDVLETQSPKLIVIDITQGVADESTIPEPALRAYINGHPSLKSRHIMVERFVPDGEKLSYYLPFALYHGGVSREDIRDNYRRDIMLRQRGYSLLKGISTYTGYGNMYGNEYLEPINTTGDTSRRPLSESSIKRMTELLEYCKAHIDVPLLFLYMPHRSYNDVTYFRFQMANTAGDLIKSYGYDFLNLEAQLDYIGLDPIMDFLDHDHLNLYGQYKNTRYLGKILTERYGISESTLSPVSRERWNACTEYLPIYYHLFQEDMQSREPGQPGIWLEEDASLLRAMEEQKSMTVP